MPLLSVFRHPRLPATWLVAAIVVAACSPVAPAMDLGQVSPTPTFAAAIPSRSADAIREPVPSDDAVTGGESDHSAASASTAPAASAPASASAPTAAPAPGSTAAAEPFAMNLYRKGDFVAQYTFEWCVGASLQMALNMATTETRTSRADQEQLWEMARDRSFSPFGGANPTGWTAVLNELGIGPYTLVSVPTLDQALTTAAEAIRATKRPVGLVMWRGRHAWVMSGFEATADPRSADEFDVTGVRVLDPLYPHGSSTWGKSPRPNSLVSPATLAKQFVVRDVTRSRVNLGVPTGYLMIIPTEG